MFFGETAISLDSKGRMAVPTRYREAIGQTCENRLVLTYSAFDSGVLWLYPEYEWERVRDEVMALSTFNPGHRNMQRRLVGSANPVEPDGTGRILIPHTLRESTGLDKHAVLMGLGLKFEIWNEAVLKDRRIKEEAALGIEASEEMTRLVL